MGLEHCFRELGQVYEAIKEADLQTFSDIKGKVELLPCIAAELLAEGFPMEIMDGETSHVPLTWVKAVIVALEKMFKDKKVFVISILGVQSTGKSTLLNTMLGLRFKVDVGRCTRGAFMQLLEIDEVLKDDLNCDIIAVIDTEGIRAPELQDDASEEHDNELATFVIGIADFTIINVYSEAQADIKDILQTAIHAFIRMKEVCKNPGCMLIHQNVTEKFADEKLKASKQRLITQLDALTQAVAKLENCESQYKQFKDIISFNENCLHYFSNLWKGNPLMAPINNGYVQDVLDLKDKLLNIVKQQKRIGNFKTFENRISSLWKAILYENYVFHFKNAVEISAYGELDAHYGQWRNELPYILETLLLNCNCKLKNCKTDTIDSVKNRCTNESTKQLEAKYNELITVLRRFIEEHEFSKLLSKWEMSTNHKLTETKLKCIDIIRKECTKIILVKQNSFTQK